MSKLVKIALASVVGLVVIVGAGALWLFGGDSPDEVSIDAATEQLTAGEQAETVGAVTPGGIAGAWNLDTDTGEFDYESATGSFVGFRIEEELTGVGSITAVGRTGHVTGALTIEDSTLTAAGFDVDMTTITTEDSRRDDNVQDAIEGSDFPAASFVLAEAVDLGEGAIQGEAISVTAAGDLTIHGVTQAVSIPLDAQLIGDTIVVVGSVTISFADYGIDVPTSPIVVSVQDFGILEFQLLFTQ